jgi:hypothetical protein
MAGSDTQRVYKTVFDLVKQTGTSAEEEGKLATIDVYFGGVGVRTPRHSAACFGGSPVLTPARLTIHRV